MTEGRPPARKTRWSGFYIGQATKWEHGSVHIYNDDVDFVITRTQALHLACEIVVYLQKKTVSYEKPVPGEIQAVVDHYLMEEALSRPEKPENGKKAPRGWDI